MDIDDERTGSRGEISELDSSSVVMTDEFMEELNELRTAFDQSYMELSRVSIAEANLKLPRFSTFLSEENLTKISTTDGIKTAAATLQAAQKRLVEEVFKFMQDGRRCSSLLF